jgi:hypothetical protein
MSSLFKFHQFLKIPIKFHRFLLNFKPWKLPRILIQNTFQIWRLSYKESCSLLENLHNHILFEIFWVSEDLFLTIANSSQFENRFKSEMALIIGPGPGLPGSRPTHYSPSAAHPTGLAHMLATLAGPHPPFPCSHVPRHPTRARRCRLADSTSPMPPPLKMAMDTHYLRAHG